MSELIDKEILNFVRENLTLEKDDNGSYKIKEILCPVYGDVVNDIHGHVLGNVSGNVGDIKGSVWGNVEGSVRGDVVNHVFGDVRGDVRGNVCGDVRGNVHGDVKARGDVHGVSYRSAIDTDVGTTNNLQERDLK